MNAAVAAADGAMERVGDRRDVASSCRAGFSAVAGAVAAAAEFAQQNLRRCARCAARGRFSCALTLRLCGVSLAAAAAL